MISKMTLEIWDNLNDEAQKEYCKSQINANNNDVYVEKRITEEYNLLRYNYNPVRDPAFEDYTIKYFESFKKFEHWQYIHYCWLCIAYNRVPKVNKPYDDFTYIKMDEMSFKEEYVIGERRKSLWEDLEKLYSVYRENKGFEIKNTEIIVGGSFVSKKEIPTDIDFVICIPKKLFFNNYESYEKYSAKHVRKNFNISCLLDFKFFPVNYKDKYFYVYSKLVHLFNKPDVTKKESQYIENNKFEKLKLIKFKKCV